ncbi:unnamed protein product, partial [marine sediment metagenome]
MRFQNTDDTDFTATPPSGGGAWTGAYLAGVADIGADTDEMVFVDEDGVTPVGYLNLENSSAQATFLVEIPE